ncbi:S-type pyocin domain-containing protein [Pseudomonas iranensis]|uniref:S-type pyocin domain-containing protein n=1 Tax=Pseudomonas iranensis TaxID=2745503 RepID=UPI001646E6BA|nr:S-type pyocin domain-containing protein [Pseudomonas iranensis]QXI22633.1 S-type pyocin domain-containing protein [Pseudomonas iranensis]
MSDQNWRPGYTELDTTHIIGNRTQTYSPDSEGGGYDRTGRTRNRSRTGSDLFSQLSRQDIAEINEAIFISQTVQYIEASKATIAHDHAVKSSQLSATLQSDINAVTASLGGVNGVTPVEAITRQRTALIHLIHTKTAEQKDNQTRANAFYGADPLTRTQQDLINVYLHIPASDVLHRWTDAYTSAFAAQRNAEELRQLTHTLHALSYQLTQAYQTEAQRVARLQAQAAAQAARAKAEAEAEHAAKVAAQIVQAKADAEQANKVAAQIAQAEQEAREDALWEEQQKQAKQRKAEQNAERRKKQVVASVVASEFDSKLRQFSLNRPENIDEKLRWIKDQYQALHAAYFAVSKAESEVGGFYRAPGHEDRWNALNNAQKEIKVLIREKHKIDVVQMPLIGGANAAVRPIITSADGLITGYEGSTFSFAKALGALNDSRAALTGGPIGVFLASVFYTPTLGNGELQRNPVVVTIPLSQFYPEREYSPVGRSTLLYWLRHRVVSSVRGEHTQLYLESPKNSFGVRVRQASFDPQMKLYTFTTEGLIPITLTWTPESPPGAELLNSTNLPATDPSIRIYPGARVTKIEGRVDEHPFCDVAGPDDYILEFPIESGIESVYMMATRGGPRYEPGMATGTGEMVGENWLDSAAQSSGSPVPAQIADQLRGLEFRNFDRFRESFWKAVAADELLRRQFGKVDLEQMANGAAPYAEPLDTVGGREKIEIHHKHRIADGGEVYGLENLRILTPKAHIELHKKELDNEF